MQAICCGYLAWHVEYAHIPAALYILKMKHESPAANGEARHPQFKVRTCENLTSSPVGMFVVLYVVPDSVDIDGVSMSRDKMMPASLVESFSSQS